MTAQYAVLVWILAVACALIVILIDSIIEAKEQPLPHERRDR